MNREHLCNLEQVHLPIWEPLRYSGGHKLRSGWEEGSGFEVQLGSSLAHGPGEQEVRGQMVVVNCRGGERSRYGGSRQRISHLNLAHVTIQVVG